MRKKIIPIIIMLMFIFSLSACKDDKASNNENNSSAITEDDSIKYFVYFDSNGGSEVSAQEVSSGSKLAKPENPTKASDTEYTYEFDNWYIDTTFSQAFDFDKDVITSSITLYAKWNQTPIIIMTYDITFDSNGGSSVASQQIVSGGKVTEPSNPTKNADSEYTYTFAGWYKDAALTEAFDFDNDIVTNYMTLFAKWNQIPIVVPITKYTVTFNSNGGSAVASQEIEDGGKVTEPSDPTKNADSEYTYTFAGWYKEETLITPFNFDSDTISSTTTIYAKWDQTPIVVPITKYTVNFNSNGGSTVASQEIEKDDYATEPDDPTKDADVAANYAFGGWYKESSLTNAFDFNNDKITSSITLYAKWIAIPKSYMVTYYNGSTQIYSESVTAGDKITYDPAAITDYMFSGWYTNPELSDYFDINTEIFANTTLYAKYTKTTSGSIEVTSCIGHTEQIHIELKTIPSVSKENYVVSYKSTEMTSYVSIDNELIRIDTNVKADIVGLKAGTYSVKIEANGESIELPNIVVSADDRSGYAHFNRSTGVGAYNNDGTLKSNAVVVYVYEENKNTVTATIGTKTYTGISAIINGATSDSIPVDIRIIGTIGAATWNQIEYDPTGTYRKNKNLPTENVIGINNVHLPESNLDESDIISGGYNTLNTSVYSKLNGLTNKIKLESDKSYDSYYNMLDVKGAKNVTVEGIGNDACIFQWGFNWKSDCESIEVKNITFDDYTEDACTFEGTVDSTTVAGFKGKYYWVHNNTFNSGINYWDVCTEQDKHDGDGTTDLKRCAYATLSYNHYYDNHKTGLVGGSDTNLTASITFHHNYYDCCQSRLPFARQANMHMYNNYYYCSTGNNMQIYAGAYAFIENCYFESTNNTFTVRENTSGTGTPAVKSYHNIFSNCSSSGATIVENRTDTVTNGNKFGQTFDTDSSMFYFDSENSRSNVSLMLSAENVKTYVPQYAGAGKFVSFNYSLTEIEENGQYEQPVVTTDFIYNPSDSAPSTSGLYYTVLDDSGVSIKTESSLSASTIVTTEDDGIHITDTAADKTTIGYYMLEDTKKFTSGTHTYNITVTLSAVGSNWAFIRLLDQNGNEFMTIGAQSDTKYMCYTFKDTTQNVIKETAFTANKTYTISLSINYDTNSANITIDGTTVTINSFDIESLCGIKFFTAKKAADRSFIVTDISIY